MTQAEAVKLARLEEKVENIQDDVADMKVDIKTILAKFDEQTETQEKKFITRLEGKVAIGTVTLIIAVLAFWFSHISNK